MSTTVKTIIYLPANTDRYGDWDLSVEVELGTSRRKDLKEVDVARILAYGLERFERALNTELKRITTEREDDAADS